MKICKKYKECQGTKITSYKPFVNTQLSEEAKVFIKFENGKVKGFPETAGETVMKSLMAALKIDVP